MPRRNDLHRILVIGSGPIIIGQAAEFDYSGTQATKALKEEGYEVILINSNPATIMTDPEFADRTYIEPVTPEFVELILEKERPDAILPTMGGQTALNVAMALARVRRAREVRRRADRRDGARDRDRRRPQAVRRSDGTHRPRGRGGRHRRELRRSRGDPRANRAFRRSFARRSRSAARAAASPTTATSSSRSCATDSISRRRIRCSSSEA